MAAMIVLIVLLQLTATHAQAVDRTLQAEASGASVVRAVVNKIQAVFGNDKQFLRRIAYVESKDGTDRNTYRNGYHGGIWQVDEVGFRATQDVSSHPTLTGKFSMIMQSFGIDWPNVQWNDLRKPLYSGIAARLFLSNIPAAIPCDIPGQATYWNRYYNTEAGAGTMQKFIDDSQRLQSTEGCKVKSDIMFVLDTSGSITSGNFNSVRNFVLQYARGLDIGPNDNQIGVITFSNHATLIFGLDTYSNKNSLEQAIRNIRYTGGGTNIPDALCELIRSFPTRSRNGAFRVAILMTDGQSNENTNFCGFGTVAEAARTVHALSPPISVFAFGVGSRYNQQDLTRIASRPEYVNSAGSFDTSQLQCVQSTQENDICHTITMPAELTMVNRASLKQGQQIRWQFSVPEGGATFNLRVERGRVQFYGSTQTTSPNEAFYEWRADTTSSKYISVRSSSQTSNVYVAIFGLDTNNDFTLQNGARKQKTGFLLLAAALVVSYLF